LESSKQGTFNVSQQFSTAAYVEMTAHTTSLTPKKVWVKVFDIVTIVEVEGLSEVFEIQTPYNSVLVKSTHKEINEMLNEKVTTSFGDFSGFQM
jgi:hypothetical protein